MKFTVWFLAFLMMLPCITVSGQVFSVGVKLKEIDSLIHHHQFALAKVKADSLLQILDHSANQTIGKSNLLEIKYRQALILDRQEGSPAQVLHTLLQIKDEAEEAHLHALVFRTLLSIALAHEKAENFDLTSQYLNMAYALYRKHNLKHLYSTYCIRKASYHRFKNELDSTLYYANSAKKFAEKYDHETDLKDSYIVLGSFHYRNGNYKEALTYRSLLLAHHKKIDDNIGIGIAYFNITNIYLKMQDYASALAYSDSAMRHYPILPLPYKLLVKKERSDLFDALNNIDSAYANFKQYHIDLQLLQEDEEKIKTKALEEQYQNGKKEAIIRNKEQQLALIGCILAVIAIASILLIKKNRQINQKNKIISKQLEELQKNLEQKQMLLAELQHRVKNNLQHVISILEIQKESANFNNIDELIRGNQNRIHSMALLHRKLDAVNNLNDVDLARYVTELAELVKDSYDDHKKKIALHVVCEIESITIERALPLGLIIVELVSNSMKHAFKKRSIGVINIAITKDDKLNKLYYADNGEGFDFNQTSEKGLGQEIIKGLIDQLNGNSIADGSNGFELVVVFE